jgi:SET domain-containing protein
MPKKPIPPYDIVVRDVKGKGRGVFALRKFRRGEMIEICPVLVIPGRHSQYILKTKLDHYAFDWDDDNDLALLLGYGMIYNHSYVPNARIVHDIGKRRSEIVALTAIKPGDEILVNYNGMPKDMSPLWFNVVDHRMGE